MTKNRFHSPALFTLMALSVVSIMTAMGQTPAELDKAIPQPPIPGLMDEESTKSQPANPKSAKVQLGVSVSKPVSAVYAQLPKLPKGSGFLLQMVTPGGSAFNAGLQPMDVIWKMNDQLLINRNQLMTLLSLHQPGDKVSISYFRAGESKQAELILQAGKAPRTKSNELTGDQPFPGAPPFPNTANTPAMPMRVISYEDRSASISDNNGTATLTFREGKPWLHVESDKGVETYNGPIAAPEDIARVPVAWRSRLGILQRSLEESIRLRKLPRIRRVPTPKERFASGE